LPGANPAALNTLPVTPTPPNTGLVPSGLAVKFMVPFP